MRAGLKVLAFGLALALAACSGGGRDATGPDPAPPGHEPPPDEPGAPVPGPAVQGSYELAQINESQPGQLVTIANPDGLVIGLFRFEATTLSLGAGQVFDLRLQYTDDKSQYGIEDEGEFEPTAPVSQGAQVLTFHSAVYDDSFTGIVLEDVVAIKYDFDGDGQLDTSFAFRRAD